MRTDRHADGQTDMRTGQTCGQDRHAERHDEANRRFSQFYKRALKIENLLYTAN
jgi:hypothetical protein